MKEFIPNTMSVDHLKKYYLEKKKSTNLFDIYLEIFGIHFEEAQKNFVESLAAYSVVCYLLNVKDRYLNFFTSSVVKNNKDIMEIS